MTMAIGNHELTISAEAVKSIIEADTPKELFEDKRVLVLTPDTTRTCPLPMMVRSMRETIGWKPRNEAGLCRQGGRLPRESAREDGRVVLDPSHGAYEP